MQSRYFFWRRPITCKLIVPDPGAPFVDLIRLVDEKLGPNQALPFNARLRAINRMRVASKHAAIPPISKNLTGHCWRHANISMRLAAACSASQFGQLLPRTR